MRSPAPMAQPAFCASLDGGASAGFAGVAEGADLPGTGATARGEGRLFSCAVDQVLKDMLASRKSQQNFAANTT
jgi:hypothetical protein